MHVALLGNLLGEEQAKLRGMNGTSREEGFRQELWCVDIWLGLSYFPAARCQEPRCLALWLPRRGSQQKGKKSARNKSHLLPPGGLVGDLGVHT